MDMIKSLRQICLEKYGENFIKEYDMLGSGEPIGDLYYTILFLDKIEEAREIYNNQKIIKFKKFCIRKI